MKIAALIGSLHWRRLAADGSDEQRCFAAEIGRRLGEPDYRPRVMQDPAAHWIDQDCMKPPGPPATTYRARRGFGGSNLTKANEHSRDRNRRSATWYARNRRGGRGILYHRHINPILVRDWSIRMDQFTATIEASANTRRFRNAGTRQMTVEDARELLAAEYIRPFVAQSDYLDTAVHPGALAGSGGASPITRWTPGARRRAQAPASGGDRQQRHPRSRIRQLGLNNSARRRSPLSGGPQVSRAQFAT